MISISKSACRDTRQYPCGDVRVVLGSQLGFLDDVFPDQLDCGVTYCGRAIRQPIFNGLFNIGLWSACFKTCNLTHGTEYFRVSSDDSADPAQGFRA